MDQQNVFVVTRIVWHEADSMVVFSTRELAEQFIAKQRIAEQGVRIGYEIDNVPLNPEA